MYLDILLSFWRTVVYRVEFDFWRSNRLYIRVSDGQRGKHKKQGAPTAPALHNSVKCPPAAAYLACESVSGQKKQSLKRVSAVCAETDSAETCVWNVGKSWARECLSHTRLFYMTDLREYDSCLTQTCLTSQSQREISHTNLPFSHFLQLFGLAWMHMHTFLFAVMVAGLHVRFVLGVFVYGRICTAVSLRLLLPCSLYRRSLFKGKPLYFPVNWPIRVAGTVWQLCFSAEECHSGKTNTPGYSFLNPETKVS